MLMVAPVLSSRPPWIGAELLAVAGGHRRLLGRPLRGHALGVAVGHPPGVGVVQMALGVGDRDLDRDARPAADLDQEAAAAGGLLVLAVLRPAGRGGPRRD